MSKLPFSKFYFTQGIRRRGEIIKPTPHTQPMLGLPRSSLLHWVSDSIKDIGPTNNTPLFGYDNRKVYVQMLTAMKEPLVGKYQLTSVPLQDPIQTYYTKNSRFKRILKSVKFFTDTNSDTVISYACIDANIIYYKKPLSRYHRWYNRYNTIWNTVEETAKISDRNQFLTLELPDIVPSLVKLKNLESEVSTKHQYVTRFRDAEFNLLDLFIWLGDKREKSLMSQVSFKNLDRVNLILTHRGRWVVLNLGVLNGFITRESNEEDGVDTRGVKPDQMQRDFLVGMILLVSSELSGIETTLTTAHVNKPASKPVKSLPVKETEVVDPEVPEITPVQSVEEPTAALNEDELDVDAILEEHQRLDTQRENELELKKLSNVSDDEEVVDEISNISTSATSSVVERPVDLSTVQAYQVSIIPQEKIAAARAKELVQLGGISLNEYNKVVALTDAYKDIPIPRLLNAKDATLSELATITEKDLTYTPKTVRDIKTVTDKSMLRMGLINYDKEIESDLLPKLYGACILGFQKKGHVVQDLVITEKKDIANDFIVFTARVIPVGGKISTVTFEIPRLDVNGRFLSGGVQYYMKKQQSDLPIRKISENEVALSSYYPTKLFVKRSEYATYDYTRWIGKQISLASMMEKPTISKLRSAKVKQNDIKLPRSYTAIASKFSGFEFVKDNKVISLSFDAPHKAEFFTEGELALEGKQDGVLIGKAQNMLYYMDFDSRIYSYNKLTASSSPRVSTEMFFFNSDERVNDIAIFNVFGKNLPLAVVLAYQMGFKCLLKTLGVNARRSTKRIKDASPTEIEFQFNKEFLYVDVIENPVAQLVLSSLNHYHRGLLDMSIDDLDDRTNISGLLNTYGLGSRYGNEITNIFAMFIDPITEKVLLEMKEPTDMVKLVLRAAELLTDDQHLDLKDTAGTRFRGSERLAGAMYRTIALACRKSGQQTILSKTRIDINPNEVKFDILTNDPSVEIYDGINPIKAAKSREVVTLGGTGGRSSDSMRSKESRLYHKNDKGIVSGDTVDSGTVGSIFYLSPDPKFINKLGMVDTFDKKKDGIGSVLSTSAQVSPCVEHDD